MKIAVAGTGYVGLSMATLLPQDCTGDVYLTVGLGARALH